MNGTVESFNEKYPIGTPVRYYPIKDEDLHFDTITRSEAWALGHGEPVVKIKGKAGCVCITHLELLPPLEEKRPAQHPIQPIEQDEKGTPRFKANAIVQHLVEGKLNELAAMNFPQEDWEQLAQLIGYSLSAFGGLSYVRNETYNAAQMMFDNGISEQQARLNDLQDKLITVKASLRKLVPELFNICEEDMVD